MFKDNGVTPWYQYLAGLVAAGRRWRRSRIRTVRRQLLRRRNGCRPLYRLQQISAAFFELAGQRRGNI